MPLRAVVLAMTMAGLAGAVQARDLRPDEVDRLQGAGRLQQIERLDAAALAKHPGGRIESGEFEEEYGRYLYQVDLRDSQGLEWDIELDAASGDVLSDHRDD